MFVNSIRESRKAALLWTGGKDCALAFYQAQLAGHSIMKLITFIPPDANFRAHSIELIQYQAVAMGISHQFIEVTEPFKESYQQAFQILQEEDRIELLITGDIGEMAGYPNWVKECAAPLDLDVYIPLWDIDQEELLNLYIEAGLKIVFSCVKKPWFTGDWLGRELTEETIQTLKVKQMETGLDLCGEQGEYHTIVLDGPFFQKSIYLRTYEACVDKSLMYLKIKEIGLVAK